MDNSAQIDYWNGETGIRWGALSDALDGMLAPFADIILERAAIKPNEKVLDIGCGAGKLSIRAAKTAAHVTGLDISEPLLAVANRRTTDIGNIDFIKGDAAKQSLRDPVDTVISRFGVMFFADPAAAFANIAKNTKPGGRLVFACWQDVAANMWARAPLEAATPFIKSMPEPPEPGTPGPFAFTDPARVLDILETAGWKDVTIEDWRTDIIMPGETAEQSADFMFQMGPLSRIIKDQDLDMAPICKALIERFKRDADKDGNVALESAVWLVGARV